MIRVILYLFLLKVSFASAANELEKFPSHISSDYLRKIAYETRRLNTFIAYYGAPGVPSFPNSINLRDCEYETGRIARNITFYNLSSTYSLKYRIDWDAQTTKILLSLSNAQIRARISFSSSETETSQDLVVNFGKMTLSYDIGFKVEKGTVIIDKTIKYSYTPNFGKVTRISEIYRDQYMPERLLEIIKANLYEEVHKKINLDDLGFLIEREMFDMHGTAIGIRFKRTVENAFNSARMQYPYNFYSEEYFDTTNMNTKFYADDDEGKISLYDITIPSFRLQRKESDQHNLNIESISFAENEVHLRGTFDLSSSRIVLTIVYHDSNRPEAKNKTLDAKYQFINQLPYTFGMVARLDTDSVELKYTFVDRSKSRIMVADDQARTDDEKWNIIVGVKNFLADSSHIATICERTFRHNIDGILSLEEIAYEVFKYD